MIFLLSGCNNEYKRISFDKDTLGQTLAKHINEDTFVVNEAMEVFPEQLPIYRIQAHDISQTDYDQMLTALNISDSPKRLEVEGNHLYYDLADYIDSSRGYFDMTEEEVTELAWDIFRKIPFIEGEFECLGIMRGTKVVDQEGEHYTRVVVSFRRLLEGVRVIGEEDCVLYFDGSGLVAIRIWLFDYEKTGTMDLIPLETAATRIKTPDDFVIETESGLAEMLHIDRIKLLFVNQYSDGCTILQPVYNYIGNATLEDGSLVEFSSKIIAIPESYTYEDNQSTNQ
jgi:hypothetical protein